MKRLGLAIEFYRTLTLDCFFFSSETILSSTYTQQRLWGKRHPTSYATRSPYNLRLRLELIVWLVPSLVGDAIAISVRWE